MLHENDIGLIEPHEVSAPQSCKFSIVQDDQRIEVPIDQLTGLQVSLLTILIAAVVTPLCIFIYNGLHGGEFRFMIAVSTVVIWLLAVVGPVAFWSFCPVGYLRPDHWIRFDRQSSRLSIRCGLSEFPKEKILALLSVTDLRKRQTELQVITGLPGAVERHFVASCRELDPQLAFECAAQKFGKFAGIPCFYSVIDTQGKITTRKSA